MNKKIITKSFKCVNCRVGNNDGWREYPYRIKCPNCGREGCHYDFSDKVWMKKEDYRKKKIKELENNFVIEKNVFNKLKNFLIRQNIKSVKNASDPRIKYEDPYFYSVTYYYGVRLKGVLECERCHCEFKASKKDLEIFEKL